MTQAQPLARINHLVVLNSLRPSEAGLSRRIFEDVQSDLRREDVGFEHCELGDARHLRAVLGEIELRAAEGMRPIIHIDMHGDEERGLWLAASGEYVSWPDLTSMLRKINAATGNNLCIVSLACFGFRLLEGLDIEQLTPFYLLIGPETEVEAGYLDDVIRPFYRELFSSLDFSLAYDGHLATRTKFYHCESFFKWVLAGYIATECQGTAKARRVERLVSEGLQGGTALTKRQLRQLAKRSIAPGPDLLDRTQKAFLGGKPAAFAFWEVMKVVADAKASPRPSSQPRRTR